MLFKSINDRQLSLEPPWRGQISLWMDGKPLIWDNEDGTSKLCHSADPNKGNSDRAIFSVFSADGWTRQPFKPVYGSGFKVGEHRVRKGCDSTDLRLAETRLAFVSDVP